MLNKRERLIVIDSNSVIHRAYHALPPLTTKKGELINAVYGFLLVFFKAIKEFQPDFIVACFDFPAPTFRSKIYKDYKAKRLPAPEELYQQIPKVKEILKGFNVPFFEKEGYEADDLIGTISKKFPKKQLRVAGGWRPEIETIILSGDLDTLQLVDKNTKVYLLKKGIKNTVLYGEDLVEEKYQGLNPGQVVDFKGLLGDPSDNIPGVTGIGEKTAIELIKKFGSLEKLYRELEKGAVLNPKLRAKLLEQKDQAFFSKDLARIKIDVPIDFNLEKCKWTSLVGGGKVASQKRKRIIKILKKLEFYSLMKKLSEPQE